MRVSRILGAQVGPAGGVPVLAVLPDQPAAKAGIRPGDRLGEPGACVSTLYRHFTPREEPRTIEWTLRRPKGSAAHGASSLPGGIPEQAGGDDSG
jgi:hypothetical protein